MRALTTLAFTTLLALAAVPPAGAVERTLELRVDGSRPVTVENLVGAVRLVPGDKEFVIRATVSADQQSVADAVQLRRVDGRSGVEVVVEYPADLARIRYDGVEIRRIDASIDYQGRRLRITSSGGERVSVDLEIAVPADARLGLQQAVGPVTADRVAADLSLAARFGRITATDGSGRLRADTGSGAVSVASFRGGVVADTGSGGVTIENVLGKVVADTGSGSVRLRGVEGDVVADTGSGSVRLDDVIGSLHVDTGSGSVRGENLVAGPELLVDTGSGSVALSGDLGAVRRLEVDTGSGSVALQSTSPLSLQLELATGSGGIRVDVPAISDVESSRRRFRGVIGAGEGTAKVSTGSGSVRISSP